MDPESRPQSAESRTESAERLRLFVRSCHLRHTLHGEINVRVSREANNCHVPRQGPAAFKRNQRETIWSLGVLAYQTNYCLTTGIRQQQELEQGDRSACDVWTIYQGPVCRQGCANREHRPPAASAKCGTHCRSSLSRKPTATLLASSSSLRPQDPIGNANSSPLCRAVAAENEASMKRTIKA